MRQVAPNGDFPENVVPVKFSPPEGMEDQVQEAFGLAHRDPEGNTVALEFMFELSQEEIAVLKHEPYLTLTIMTDTLYPFALQTSYPPDEKYRSIMEHTHWCKSNLTHENDKPWRCDNPRHSHIKFRDRECDECWQERQEQMQNQSESSEDAEVPVE